MTDAARRPIRTAVIGFGISGRIFHAPFLARRSRLLARRHRDERPVASCSGRGAIPARPGRGDPRGGVGGCARARPRRDRLAERHARRPRRRRARGWTRRGRRQAVRGDCRRGPRAHRQGRATRPSHHGVPEPAVGRRLPHLARARRRGSARRGAPLRVAVRVVAARARRLLEDRGTRPARAAASSTTSARTSSTRPRSSSGPCRRCTSSSRVAAPTPWATTMCSSHWSTPRESPRTSG